MSFISQEKKKSYSSPQTQIPCLFSVFTFVDTCLVYLSLLTVYFNNCSIALGTAVGIFVFVFFITFLWIVCISASLPGLSCGRRKTQTYKQLLLLSANRSFYFWWRVNGFPYFSLYSLHLCFSHGPLLQRIKKKRKTKVRIVYLYYTDLKRTYI